MGDCRVSRDFTSWLLIIKYINFSRKELKIDFKSNF